MKRVLLVCCGFAAVMLLCAFALWQVQTARLLQQAGVGSDEISRAIFSSFTSNYFSYPNINRVKRIAAGDRVEAVREIYAYAKSYIQTPEFKKQYLEWRENQKPEPPEKPKTMAEQREAAKAQLQKSIKEAEQNMKKMPADYQATMKESIAILKQQLKEYDDPNNPMFTPEMEQMNQEMYANALENHKQRIAEWEAAYPTDPRPIVKTWLTKFLDISKDVDFSAALKQGEGGKMVFVNAAYEAKSSEWKMCYRAGRDVVQAARTAAQQWLRELQ